MSLRRAAKPKAAPPAIAWSDVPSINEAFAALTKRLASLEEQVDEMAAELDRRAPDGK